jgi:hypothetical protein
MAGIWPDVKRVFEALSYVVKGMSPDGTELFYTVSYDTYLRRDTSDLCAFLETKATKGETDISYRLNLQLQNLRAKLANAKFQKGKKAIVRPMSFYILTNGEWGKGVSPIVTIKETANFMLQNKFPAGQVTISFISFAQSATAMHRIGELAKADFGM